LSVFSNARVRAFRTEGGGEYRRIEADLYEFGLPWSVSSCACHDSRFFNDFALWGHFTAVSAKHSENFSLEDSLAIGVDRMQRNFQPMRRQVEEWRGRQISTVAAKLIIYQAFVESELDAPKPLARQVHDLYFRPTHPEFEPRRLWSLSKAFTSAFKELDPIPRFKTTAKLAGFLQSVRIYIGHW
jgi:ligand-binding SRPBCC domain-containing protein